ncbi:OAM dimerization domain-containing protein [Vulgatibacter incomptus]|uniref:L-beta-lysine 5,6-aminomutase beta subunit n=1 Tax=Vulgatibacter incomptus TaxID=1391653 RepID=A0A0K1PDZ8_9BACT|nr:OAM dimerization domain-containing protein [Vulgatibacter incomptus]AKU91651.1 L-beta-lysine 5,6-aminomutase beta subunit [Vulgatibacter incomptus]
MKSTVQQIIRPYGDRKDDGVMQLSFVLPVAASEKAKEAARQILQKQGFVDVLVAQMEKAGEGYTFFVCYAKTQLFLDYASIDVPEVKIHKLGFDALNDAIEAELGRKIIVVGGCTGTDAHAVGIDAIMNMKGYAADYGLERYPMFDALNMGSQVLNEAILAKALDLGADAILVSQVVTQRDVHKDNSRQLVELIEQKGLKGRFLLLLGGPRIDHKLALELGYDAGFGPGTKPSDVANFLFGAVKKRAGKDS